MIAEKPGFLEIDEGSADVVRQAFKIFLKEGTLASTAKWLNANGFKVKREIQGGNHRPRLGHFTVDNLHFILTNKSYIGVRRYKAKEELKETRAVWAAIIDEDTFNRVQNQLKANHCRKKPAGGNRFPFLLPSLVSCSSCNERMLGKSAHGNGGKIPYYEHGWAVRRQACLVKQVFHCKPFRVTSKKLEPEVWMQVSGLLNSPKLAREIIDSAQALHKSKTKSSEIKRLQEKIRSLESQSEVLAERLAQRPKKVSPTHVLKQMEKLEAIKQEEGKRLSKAQQSEVTRDIPAPLKSYEAFLLGLGALSNQSDSETTKEKIIKKLIHKIQVTPQGFKLHVHTGRDYVETELANQAGSSANSPLKIFWTSVRTA